MNIMMWLDVCLYVKCDSLTLCCFFEVGVIDDDYGNDFNDGDLLLMVHFTCKNDGDVMVVA